MILGIDVKFQMEEHCHSLFFFSCSIYLYSSLILGCLRIQLAVDWIGFVSWLLSSTYSRVLMGGKKCVTQIRSH